MDQLKDREWINRAWEDVAGKLKRTSQRIGISFPHQSVNGQYDNASIDWWTNGFWPGLMWLMVHVTNDQRYRRIAEGCEEKLDEAFNRGFDGLHHDVGFMWMLSAVANYRLTGNADSRRRGLIAAAYLASRFNIRGEYLRAWNDDKVGWTIIDSMMNLPLLYWASQELDDPRFRFIAEAHANKVLKYFIREDGSVEHIIDFNPYTGEKIASFGGQGYENGSAWARGQAWAIYGFVLSYNYTKEEKYLNAAKRVAHFFIAALPEDRVSPCDFRAPEGGGAIKDVTATACAASGFLEIVKAVPDYEKKLYQNAALQMLAGLYHNYGAWDEDEEGLLTKGTIAYHQTEGRHVPLIYGDFFFVEALLKLKGKAFSIWEAT